MRWKYQLRGLGIGLIITTIILTISNNVRRLEAERIQNHKPPETSGSVLAFDKDATKDSAGEETNGPSETETGSETPTESKTEPPSEEATTKAPETPAPTPVQTTAPPVTGETVTVSIKNVYYARQAADILYNAGLITDKSDFVNYLDKNGYAERICEGVYEISKGASYEVIAKSICRIKS